MTIFYIEDDKPQKPLPPVYASEVEDIFYVSSARGKRKRLREVLVDPGYELESVSPADMLMYEKICERFYNRQYEPISFGDLKAAMYVIGNKMGKKISDFQILHILRRLWRAGILRRYILGKMKRMYRPGRGEWYGVHYLLKWNPEDLEKGEIQ